MLRYAIEFKSSLLKANMLAMQNPANRFYYAYGYMDYSITIDEGDWNKLQMVSVSDDLEVIGYFKADIDRTCRKAHSISAINFAEKNNITFSVDMFNFFDGLFFARGLNKIEWCVVVGNPAEHLYDRIVRRYEGQTVGVLHDSAALLDGTTRDIKYYELMRDQYMKHRRFGNFLIRQTCAKRT